MPSTIHHSTGDLKHMGYTSQQATPRNNISSTRQGCVKIWCNRSGFCHADGMTCARAALRSRSVSQTPKWVASAFLFLGGVPFKISHSYCGCPKYFKGTSWQPKVNSIMVCGWYICNMSNGASTKRRRPILFQGSLKDLHFATI